MAIFELDTKVNEKSFDDATVLDKIIKLVFIIGLSYLFSQTPLFYIYPILIFSPFFNLFTSLLSILPLRIRILFSKHLGRIYSDLFLFLFYIFTSDGRPDHHYQIALPVVIFLIASLLSSTFYRKFYSSVVVIILFLFPLTLHNIYFVDELANLDPYKSFSVGIYIILLIYPFLKLYGAIKYGDKHILDELGPKYWQIIPFICLSIVAYNSSMYLILIVICFKAVLYTQYVTYDSNSNYFSRVYHENVIIKNSLDGLLRVDIIMFMSVAILVSFFGTSESIEKASISNVIFVYSLITISYTILYVMFNSRIRNKYMVIGDVNIAFDHEKVSTMNLMNMPTFKLYDKYFRESLEIENKNNFDFLTSGTECLFVVDVFENGILDNVKAKSGVVTYYLYRSSNVPFQVKNYANLTFFENNRFSLSDFINERNIESALVLKTRIERFMGNEGLHWQEKHGLQDLLNMRIQLFNIGDIQLRVLAGMNLIEMNIRYYYFLRRIVLDRTDSPVEKVSMGLIVGELRRCFGSELSIPSFEVRDESYTLFKRALIEIKYLDKFSRKNSILSLLNIAVFLRNKTMGHGSVMSISSDLWILTEYISLTVNNFFAPFFSKIHFYYEDENGSYTLNCNKHRKIRSIDGDSFFRYNNIRYKTDMYKVLEGFIYIYNGSVNGNREYINYINGKRIKPDVISI